MIYSTISLILTRMFSFFCHFRSLRHKNESFSNESFINDFIILYDVAYDEIPHGDIIKKYFENVSIDQFREVIYGMVRDFINKKYISNYRIQKNIFYYHIGMLVDSSITVKTNIVIPKEIAEIKATSVKSVFGD